MKKQKEVKEVKQPKTANVNLERRIKKHIHAQVHTVECLVPGGFSELAKRTATQILAGLKTTEDTNPINIRCKDGRVRIENIPFEGIHRLLLQGLVFTEVNLRIAKSRCSTEKKLFEVISAIDWDLWLPMTSSTTIDVRVDSISSQLYHEGRIKDAVHETFKKVRKTKDAKGQPNRPAAIGIDIILQREVLEVFLSVGGRDFWKRGHKEPLRHAAPLREDIAACLIQRLREFSLETVGAETPTHILNPFCGTGTLLHEAALNIFELGHRISDTSRWSYLSLPFFKANAFAHQQKLMAQKTDSLTKNQSGSRICFVGEDLDGQFCEYARGWFESHADALEPYVRVDTIQTDSCSVQKKNTLHIDSGDSLWLIANPPFGLRLSPDSTGGTDTLYAKFGKRSAALLQILSQSNARASGVILCPNESTWKILKKELSSFKCISEHFTLGGLDVRALYFTNVKR